MLTAARQSRRVTSVMSPSELTMIRRATGLSQEGMARLLGVSFASINRWERGRGSPVGLHLEVYRAMQSARVGGVDLVPVVADDQGGAGRVLMRIFVSAYGGTDPIGDPAIRHHRPRSRPPRPPRAPRSAVTSRSRKVSS